MSSQRDEERWGELRTRQESGETLSDGELEFCDHFEQANPALRIERELLESLADMDAAPDAASGALVDAVLGRLEDDGTAELTPVRVSRARTGLGAGRALLVAAAALLLVVMGVREFRASTASQPTAASTGEVSPSPSRVELVYTSGHVNVNGQSASVGPDLLEAGAVVSAGEGGACLSLEPNIDVCLGESSEVRVSQAGSTHRVVELVRGRVGVQLDHQPGDMKFSIVSDGVWSTAVGTTFSVERNSAGVSTTVLEGRVRVGKKEAGHVVQAHQRAHVGKGDTAVAAVSRADESPQWQLLRPAHLWSDRVSAALELRGAPAGSQVWLDGQSIGLAPLSSLIPSGRRRLEVRAHGSVLMQQEFEAHAGQTHVVNFVHQTPPRLEPPPALVPAEVPAPGPVRPAAAPKPTENVRSAADLLAEARRLMRDARWTAAALKYEQLRTGHPGSPEARTVLLPLAQLQLDHLGQPAMALRSLDTYLAPGHGSLQQEARHTRIRALGELGRGAQEAQAIQAFLEKHPKSFQARALRTRLAELSGPE